jgi:hypothetical protein
VTVAVIVSVYEPGAMIGLGIFEPAEMLVFDQNLA